MDQDERGFLTHVENARYSLALLVVAGSGDQQRFSHQYRQECFFNWTWSFVLQSCWLQRKHPV